MKIFDELLVAALLVEAGLLIVSTAFISPFASDRSLVKKRLGTQFIEIYVNTELSVCSTETPRGYTERQERVVSRILRELIHPMRIPANPDLVLDAGVLSAEQCAEKVITYLLQRGMVIQGGKVSAISLADEPCHIHTR